MGRTLMPKNNKEGEIEILSNIHPIKLYTENLKPVKLQLKIIEERKNFFKKQNCIIYKIKRYLTPNNKILYIFIGEVSQHVIDILNKIEINFNKNIKNNFT